MRRKELRRFLLGITAMVVILAGCGAKNDRNIMQTESPLESIPTTPTSFTPDFCEVPGAEDGYIHSYPLETVARYDLNGDGIGEDIRVNAPEYADGSLCIADAQIQFSSISPTGYFTVWNMGDCLLVGISDYGFSDDPITILYAYDGETIRETGYFEDIAGTNAWGHDGAICHGDGTLSARTRFDVLGTWNAIAKYEFISGALVDITDFYTYIAWDEQSLGWDVTTKVNIVTYEDIWNGETQIIVPAGTELSMLGIQKGSVEGTYWVCFQADSTGKELWMAAEVVDWYTQVAAESGFLPSEEAFVGFFYAG